MMDVGLICTSGLSTQESGCGAADTHRRAHGCGHWLEDRSGLPTDLV